MHVNYLANCIFWKIFKSGVCCHDAADNDGFLNGVKLTHMTT